MKHLNPPSLAPPRGYTHVVETTGSRAIYISGQIATDQQGRVVGAGDFEAQARQTFENLRTVLDEAGASTQAIVKLNVYLTDIALLRDYGRIRAELLPGPAPAGTAVQVVALAIPGMMLEVEAVAVV